MKKLFTSCCILSAIIFSQNTLAQKQKPDVPCCTILSAEPPDGIQSANPPDGIVLVRNNTTGRTFMFKADALDINNLHVGDAINADMTKNRITAIKGISRGYSINEPNPGVTCCGVTNIQSGPSVICCSIVSIQNNGNTYSFSVPKNISSTLKVGQPVSLALQNSYALFRTNINGSVSTYSYPVKQGEKKGVNKAAGASERGADKVKVKTNTLADSSQTQKLKTGPQPWEIHPDATIKGIGGQITMQVPKELGFHTHIKFFEAGDTKKIVASWFGNNSAKLLPGLYDALVDDKYTIKNIRVEIGKQTRLKMGVFKVTGYGTIEIENSNTHQKFSAGGPFSKVLPEGTYYINGKKKVPVVIKDGEMTEL